MFFNKKRVLIAFATAICLTVLIGVASPVQGQNVPDPTNSSEQPEDPTEVTDQLGDLVIHSYSYDGEEMTISASWRGNMSTTVTLTEMIEMDSGGSSKISFKRVRMLPDTRRNIKIQIDERSSGTAAVLLTTPESVENSNALILQEGDAKNRGPIPFSTASMLIGGAAIAGAGLAFAFTARAHENSEAERRERIA